MYYPITRMRRLRGSETLRAMVRENHLSIDDLIYPLFVIYGENVKNPVDSMPGVYQLSVDNLVKECKEIVDLGLKAVLIFGIPEHKDEVGSGAYAPDGIVQRAVAAIKKEFPDLYVITDVCLCEYTSHGHCGMISGERILNDPTLNYLADTALSHAVAGADMVVFPSPFGKFPLLRERYLQIGHHLLNPWCHIKSVFPMPGGGVMPNCVHAIYRDLGPDSIMGAGGAIHGHPMGPVAGARAMRQVIDAAVAGIPLVEAAREHPELQAAVDAWGLMEEEEAGIFDIKA